MHDDDIAQKIKDKSYVGANGKRLRHERQKPERLHSAQAASGNGNEFHMLNCYDLMETPAPELPEILHAKPEGQKAF